MAIEWLAGNRLRGTTAERPAFGLPSGSVGGWVEVGRTTLGSANTDILVSSLPDKRYYMILGHGQGYGSAVSNFRHRFNGDTNNNYASRQNQNGGSDSTYTSLNGIQQDKATNGNSGAIIVGYVANKSDKEKLMMMHTGEFGNTGAGTAPVNRKELVGKWTNTSNAISSYTWTQYQGTDQFQSGNEVVILGWDPDDTHTTNFWEELADTTFTSSGVSAQTFTAKKYLWCQFWFTSDASGNGQYFQLGDTGGIDTGSTYARRFSINGGADSTSASQSKIYFAPQTGAVTHFVNMFMINDASNEKLVMIHATTNNGSGAGNAPQRRETIGKWVETTNQCDRITIATDAGTFTGGQLKVWGAD